MDNIKTTIAIKKMKITKRTRHCYQKIEPMYQLSKQRFRGFQDVITSNISMNKRSKVNKKHDMKFSGEKLVKIYKHNG